MDKDIPIVVSSNDGRRFGGPVVNPQPNTVIYAVYSPGCVTSQCDVVVVDGGAWRALQDELARLRASAASLAAIRAAIDGVDRAMAVSCQDTTCRVRGVCRFPSDCRRLRP